MLLIMGTRESRKKLGYVASFCVFCRETRKVRLDKLQMYKHFYYINYSPASEPWNIQKCTECGGEIMVNSNDFTKILKKQNGPLEELIIETNPYIQTTHKKRFELEKIVQRSLNQLSTDERKQLLKEPFRSLASQIEQSYSSGMHISLQTLALLVIGISGTVLMFSITSTHEGSNNYNRLGSNHSIDNNCHHLSGLRSQTYDKKEISTSPSTRSFSPKASSGRTRRGSKFL